MTNQSNKTLALLSCMAHPSDEAFTMGGTLALYARRGVNTYVLSGTRGEVGEMDPALLKDFDSIGARREAELTCAAQVLGLSGVYFLGYRDSGMPGSPEYNHPDAMAAQPVDNVAARIVHFMRMLKPQVVVTHDPIGGYKHPDHIALYRATKRAFEVAANPDWPDELPPFQPSKLYYQTFSKDLMRWAVRLGPLLGMDPRHFGRNGDIDLVALIKEGDFPVHARIDCRSVSELRDKASACHISQGGGGTGRSPLSFLRRFFGASETYMREYPPPEKGSPETDLFAGIDGL